MAWNRHRFQCCTTIESIITYHLQTLRHGHRGQLFIIIERTIANIRHAFFNNNRGDRSFIRFPGFIFTYSPILHRTITTDRQRTIAREHPCQVRTIDAANAAMHVIVYNVIIPPSGSRLITRFTAARHMKRDTGIHVLVPMFLPGCKIIPDRNILRPFDVDIFQILALFERITVERTNTGRYHHRFQLMQILEAICIYYLRCMRHHRVHTTGYHLVGGCLYDCVAVTSTVVNSIRRVHFNRLQVIATQQRPNSDILYARGDIDMLQLIAAVEHMSVGSTTGRSGIADIGQRARERDILQVRAG